MDLIGASDQGLCLASQWMKHRAYAIAISLSHKLVRRLAELRKSGEIGYLRPDAKSQVTVEYDNGQPARVDTVVISTQHDPEVTNEEIHQ